MPVSYLRQGQTQDTSSSETVEENDNENDEDENEDDTQITAAKCNDRKLGKCALAYAKSLGLKSLPTDPVEFSRDLQAIIAKYGKIGFKKICLSGAKFVKCLGGRQQFEACINVTHLIELGLTKQQALGYYTIGRVQAFECTKGFRVLYDNFDCIKEVAQRSNATFVKCAQDFEKNVTRDPKNVCKYAQSITDCDTKPYARKCKRQVATTVCQILQVVFKPLLPQCKITCNRNIEVISSDESDEDPSADGLAV